MKLKLMLLLLGVLLTTFTACKKEDGRATNITGINLASPKPGILTGTFTATGGINTSGTHVMVVEPTTADSIHCTWTMTAPEGTFIMIQDCSLSDMTGAWYIQSGTGAYKFLNGKGNLTMMFPPDPMVPPGALGVEENVGVIWWHN